MNFNVMNTSQNDKYLDLKDCGVYSKGQTVPPTAVLHIDLSPSPASGTLLWTKVPFDHRSSPNTFGPIFTGQHNNTLFGF
jgi:hypothetical protein